MRTKPAGWIMFMGGAALGGLAVALFFNLRTPPPRSAVEDLAALDRRGRQAFGAPGTDPVQVSPAPGRLVQKGGAPLLPAPATSSIEMFIGAPIGGEDIVIQSVISDRAFWIGGAKDRLLVRIDDPKLRPVLTKPGQKVTVHGVMRPLPPEFESKFEMAASHGSKQLKEQGAYLYALTLDVS